jgi:uncharacterized protein
MRLGRVAPIFKLTLLAYDWGLEIGGTSRRSVMAPRISSRGLAAATAASLMLALLLPAQAQFWGDWGGGRYQRQQRYDNPWGGGWFSPSPRGYERDRDVDYSRAPAPSQKKPEATTTIVVMGDANADWLGYGLEDAFSEKPEIAIVRKHRTDSGLIRYDQRRDIEWPQMAREIIAAEKPKFIVMMIGNNDRQQIREKAPPVARANPQKPSTTQPAPPATSAAPAPTAPGGPDPEQQPPERAAEPPANMTPEQARQAAYGPWEFHTEKWELAYIKRIDATIAALKSAGVPVLWVGLPSQRGTKASADSAYLNEIYRSRAEKAGITYVDIWDGFVDEAGRFSPQGPDYEGQIRRLRTADGVYFTKYGARKVAHYVEREIQRIITNRGIPVALPVPVEQGPQGPNTKPGGPAQRPNAGPVLPLTATNVGTDELLGSGRAGRAPATDASANRVLSKGEPLAAPTGRADDFSWPRGTAATEPLGNEPADAGSAAAGAGRSTTGGQRAAEDATQNGQAASGEPKRPRRTRRSDAPRPFSFPGMFR